MLKKLLTISFISFAALVFAASPAFASNENSNKPAKNDIVYDTPDSGDNAHPSGKDRSVENGRSLTQGKSKSDPDNNGKGPDRLNTGLDKPGMGGGVDKADQDGNNGCGNDDDFEDDNEGWCGQKPKEEKPEEPKTPEQPNVPGVGGPTPTPKVLTLTNLPNTGIPASNSYSLIYLALSLIFAGSSIHVANKAYEKFGTLV